MKFKLTFEQVAAIVEVLGDDPIGHQLDEILEEEGSLQEDIDFNSIIELDMSDKDHYYLTSQTKGIIEVLSKALKALEENNE